MHVGRDIKRTKTREHLSSKYMVANRSKTMMRIDTKQLDGELY
jgi:hypothetical protein